MQNTLEERTLFRVKSLMIPFDLCVPTHANRIILQLIFAVIFCSCNPLVAQRVRQVYHLTSLPGRVLVTIVGVLRGFLPYVIISIASYIEKTIHTFLGS